MTPRQVAVVWVAHLSMFAVALYLVSVAASNGRDMTVFFTILLALFFLGNSLLLDRRRQGAHRKGRTRKQFKETRHA